MPGLLDGRIAAWVGPLILVMARVGGLAVTAPAWSTPGLGWRIRVGLILLVTAMIAPAVLMSKSCASAA